MNLINKFILVTGSAQGIGKQIALTLANYGAKIILNDINEKELNKTKIFFHKRNINVDAYCADVSNENEVDRLFNYVIDNHKRIDVLVNNAGISPKDKNNKQISTLDMKVEEWDHVIEVNLRSVFLCSKYAAKFMIPNKTGKIINIGSMMGKVGSCGHDVGYLFPLSTSGSHYCVSKAAVICLTKCMARELSKYGIRVNCVSPGAVAGGMGKFDETLIDNLKKQIPLGELASQQDIANSVLYLVSDLSDYITGEILDVNGGWLMD